MSRRVYLDWNATAPLRPEARDAMMAALDAAGNPSSVHREGSAARRIVELAREQVAALVGAEPRDVVFTSGGTEANVMALTPELRGADGGEIPPMLWIGCRQVRSRASIADYASYWYPQSSMPPCGPEDAFRRSS